MLTIYKGDDFNFDDDCRRVIIRFNTELDLTGWSAKFDLLDNQKTTDDITSLTWMFEYTAEETKAFSLGRTFGKLTLTDANGDVRQIAKVVVDIVNYIPCPPLEGTIAVSIDNLVANYDFLENKPSLNGKTIEGDQDSSYYDIPSSQDYSDLTKRVDGLTKKLDGESAIGSLAFTGEGDPYHWFKMKVVMRDDGAGNMVPTIGLQTTEIPDESDSEASE